MKLTAASPASVIIISRTCSRVKPLLQTRSKAVERVRPNRIAINPQGLRIGEGVDLFKHRPRRRDRLSTRLASQS